MHLSSTIPIIGFAAYSGTGKTTLLEKLIPVLSEEGLRLAVIKHAHHDFDIDIPGKDSYKLRKAGAIDTIVASSKRWARIHENQSNDKEPDLNVLIKELNKQTLDIILVEGFKHENIPRIELRRAILNKPLLYPDDPNIIAIATDQDDDSHHTIVTLDINAPLSITQFILKHFFNS